ncbi:hypothetical protein C5167_021513 [Papaver somniferum]|nr:hypothetical protein C5167_021513 [Papaver somniferum]
MVRGVRKKISKKRPALSEDGSVVLEEVAEVPEPPELTPELWESWRDKVPPGINRNVWHDSVDHEKKPETIVKNVANSKRIKQATVCLTLGRCSYANKKYKLDDSGILQIPKDATDKWLLRHQRRDGSVHPSAIEPHKKVLEAKAKCQEEETSGSKSTVVSEELEDVFGANRKDCASLSWFVQIIPLNYVEFLYKYTRSFSFLCKLNVTGPTSFSPIIETTIDIVEKSGRRYHVLLIIADGQGDGLQVKVNKLSSTKTQLPCDYYFLKYCNPSKSMNSAEHLGEVLRGDRIENSIYTFNMREELTCKVACRTKLDAEAANNFKEKIDYEY